MLWGQPVLEDFTFDKGKIYDLSFNAQTKDLALAHKEGDVILSLETGKVQINLVTSEVLQTFEKANAQIDRALAQKKQKTHIGFLYKFLFSY
ncbi:hypothetical protein [Nostoc sp. FACHB-145]|uniref:hypothetical protein n=1 Tax=Nostoc sp. FACHB-145 TaxID=2692836 RepID=UPI0016897B62|nr:hypothetical protein [Nostoc sp. FACHB-145]MBD2472147.1 hypothetical protein [Nostoc sp. FACHB-145]